MSQGEIVKILNKEATKLLPMYEELKTRLRQESVLHLDDYAVYDFIKNHQLCFAHLIRKWRDLAFSAQLDEETSKHYTQIRSQEISHLQTNS